MHLAASTGLLQWFCLGIGEAHAVAEDTRTKHLWRMTTLLFFFAEMGYNTGRSLEVAVPTARISSAKTRINPGDMIG